MKSICILLIFGLISAASTYKCLKQFTKYIQFHMVIYMCSAADNPNCGDPFMASGMTGAQIIEASEGQVCNKARSGDIVVRGVLPTTGCVGGPNGCRTATQGGITATLCCCTSDLCN
ncbi:unnamed protein product, partial [Rotaria sordida]